jgi:hypothetical protein
LDKIISLITRAAAALEKNGARKISLAPKRVPFPPHQGDKHIVRLNEQTSNTRRQILKEASSDKEPYIDNKAAIKGRGLRKAMVWWWAADDWKKGE